MTLDTPDAPTPGLLGPDPGLSIRRWAALLLRLGIGLGLLNSGLAGYLGNSAGTGPPSGPFFAAFPYVEIALGLALVLGFLTTGAAIGAGFTSLAAPAMMTIQLLTVGVPQAPAFANNPNPAMLMMMIGGAGMLPGLLANAALIWLSPLENHPYSVDALIFGRVAPEPFRPPSSATTPGAAAFSSPEEAPAPGPDA